MARRAAVVEDFDDDTDLPLPSRSLLTNARGPLLEEIGASDDDDSSDDDPDQSVAGPASPPSSQYRPALGPSSKPPSNTITDITPYKKSAFPLSCSLTLIPAPDGLAYIQYTSTQSDPMAEANAGSPARRASGGPSARTLQKLLTASDSAPCTKSTSPTPVTGRTPVASAYSGRRTGGSSTA